MDGIVCHRCVSDRHTKLRRQITSSGASQVTWYCLFCKRWALSPVNWLPHMKVEQLCAPFDSTIDDIPVVKDHRGDCQCVICGEPAEVHHWAPQALREAFGEEWELWPWAALCVGHHRQWHDIVTPGLGLTSIDKQAEP